MKIHYHQYDLPDQVKLSGMIAIDTETMGLMVLRDRLCVVQLTNGNGEVHLVHFPKPTFDGAKNLIHLLKDDSIQKIFHFARFDVAVLQHTFKIQLSNIYCTKIASKLSRTFTSQHSLKNLCEDLLGITLDKEKQTSDWGQDILSDAQKKYAALDVFYLHALKEKLDQIVAREGRHHLLKEILTFLPTRSTLDILYGESYDIFSHN